MHKTERVNIFLYSRYPTTPLCTRSRWNQRCLRPWGKHVLCFSKHFNSFGCILWITIHCNCHKKISQVWRFRKNTGKWYFSAVMHVENLWRKTRLRSTTHSNAETVICYHALIVAKISGRFIMILLTVINKVKSNKDLGYQTYTTLVDSCVVPILTYGSAIWGFKYHKCCENVILRACRFYLGVHRLTAIPGIQGDMGWLDCKSRWRLEMIRLYNRFITMDQSRLTLSALSLFHKIGHICRTKSSQWVTWNFHLESMLTWARLPGFLKMAMSSAKLLL